MMNRNKAESQPEAPKPCTLYTYSTNIFELFSHHPSAQEYLENQGYQALYGGNIGIVSSYRLPENSRLAHKFAVLISHVNQDHLILLRDFQFSEFMQRWACIAPIIQDYLPIFQGQAMMKTLPNI